MRYEVIDYVAEKALAMGGKEMVFAEHDKKKQFEKILTIIKEKAATAVVAPSS